MGPDAPQSGTAPTDKTLLTNGGVAPGDRLEVFGGYADGMPRVRRGGTRKPVRGDNKLNLSALLCANYIPSEFNEGDPKPRGWFWLKSAQALMLIPLPFSQMVLQNIVSSSRDIRHEVISENQAIVQIYTSLFQINGSADYPIKKYIQPKETANPYVNQWDFFTLLIENGKVTRLEATRRITVRPGTEFSYSSDWDPYLPYLLGATAAPPIYQNALTDLSDKELARSTVYQGKLYQIKQPTYPLAVGNFFSDSPRQFSVEGGGSAPTTLPIAIDDLELNKSIHNAWVGSDRWDNWINNDSDQPSGSFQAAAFRAYSLKLNNLGWSIGLKVASVRAFES